MTCEKCQSIVKYNKIKRVKCVEKSKYVIISEKKETFIQYDVIIHVAHIFHHHIKENGIFEMLNIALYLLYFWFMDFQNKSKITNQFDNVI